MFYTGGSKQGVYTEDYKQEGIHRRAKQVGPHRRFYIGASKQEGLNRRVYT